MRENEASLLGFLGIGSRAGKLIFGQTRCMNGVRAGKVHLIVLDGSVSGNTRKAFTDSCRQHRIQCVILDECNVLGRALGRPDNRIVGVGDAAFARSAVEKHEGKSGGKRVEQD